jgi:hypothetical protein
LKFLLPVIALAVLPACSNLSSQQGHAEYRTPDLAIYNSPKLGKLSIAGVVSYDSPEAISPDAPVYPK